MRRRLLSVVFIVVTGHNTASSQERLTRRIVFVSRNTIQHPHKEGTRSGIPTIKGNDPASSSRSDFMMVDVGFNPRNTIAKNLPSRRDG
jgi:hypothetical protein